MRQNRYLDEIIKTQSTQENMYIATQDPESIDYCVGLAIL
jgi:hypothetical protein